MREYGCRRRPASRDGGCVWELLEDGMFLVVMDMVWKFLFLDLHSCIGTIVV